MFRHRYGNLLRIIRFERCKTIMEIGVYDGKHARQMIETAKISYRPKDIEYYGFDLFESQTSEDLKKEFAKRPLSSSEVKKTLQKTGANIKLYIGYTTDTLPDFVKHIKDKSKIIDFIFIDGGHSFETIALDWEYAKQIMGKNTTVIFDDYFHNKENAVSGVGCQNLIDTLDRSLYDVEMLQPEDQFQKDWGILRITMVKVNRRN